MADNVWLVIESTEVDVALSTFEQAFIGLFMIVIQWDSDARTKFAAMRSKSVLLLVFEQFSRYHSLLGRPAAFNNSSTNLGISEKIIAAVVSTTSIAGIDHDKPTAGYQAACHQVVYSRYIPHSFNVNPQPKNTV